MHITKPRIAFVSGIVALTLLGAGCSGTTATDTTKNTNAKIGQATVPAAGSPGAYKGKLETLLLTANDLPTAYKPYQNNTSTQARYFKITDTASGVTQQYNPELITSTNRSFTINMPLVTLKDTATAAQYYNTAILVAPIGLTSEDTQGTFTGIGDANYYQTSSYVNQYEPEYNNTTWSVWILKSNLVITAQIIAPTTFTADQVKSLLTKWEQKTTTYKPATEKELQQENNSAS